MQDMVGRLRKLRFGPFDLFATVFCLIFSILCFYPIWFVFIVSIMEYDQFIAQDFILLPPLDPAFKYYITVVTGELFQRAFVISVFKTALGALVGVVITAMLAYAVSKKTVSGMNLLNHLIIFTLFFNGGLIPTYLLIRSFGMLNTFWVMVVPSLITISHFIVMRNYFAYSVSKELEEAALIDGAREVTIFFRIIIPLSMPIMAAIFLFLAIAHWNDYYSYLIYVDDTRLQPFVWVLRRMIMDPSLSKMNLGGGNPALNDYIPPFSLKMTVIICAMLPIVIVYPFLQKHFAKGVMIGAVKE